MKNPSMMKTLAAAALLVVATAGVLPVASAETASVPAAAAPISASKKVLIDKLIQLQQPGVENVARQMLQQSLAQMAQGVGNALQQQPADKREALGKSIEAEMRKFFEDALPMLRERGQKLAGPTWTPMLDERFSEDELKQIVAWLESPVSKKYQQSGLEMMNALAPKLANEARPLLESRFKALDQSIAKQLGIQPPKPASAPAAAAPAPAPKAPAKK